MTTVITVDDLRQRFALPGRRSASALMRRMRHVRDKREQWTTEEWLAEWLAARALPGVQRSTKVQYDPLEQAVIERAVAVVRAMVARGELKVTGHLDPRAA